MKPTPAILLSALRPVSYGWLYCCADLSDFGLGLPGACLGVPVVLGEIRDGKWKLVTRSFARKTGSASKWELYDLSVDPTEMDYLTGQQPEVAQRLRELWQKWYNESYESEAAAGREAGR